MKLVQLHIENFGVYHGRTFEFGEGLQVVYGPNEAGKSTLLNVLRHAFFGFPHRNPYGAVKADKPVAVSAKLRLADGRTVEFRRQKGQPDHISGAIEREGTELDAARLAGLLQGAHDALFRHIFAFSLEELAAAEKSLSDAGMSEALFGGGIGGLDNFLRVRTEVEETHKGLFNSRGRKGEINQLLTRLGEASNEYKAATLKPRDLDELRDALDEVQRTIERIRTTQDLHRGRLHRLDRLKDALPHWRRSRALRQEIERSPVPASLQRADAETLRRLQQQLDHLDEEIRRHTAEREEARARGASSEPSEDRRRADARLRQEAGGIRQLAEDLGRYRSAQDELRRLGRDGAPSLESVEARLRDLHPTWTIGDLMQLSTSLAEVAAAEGLGEEFRTLRSRSEVLAAKRPDLELQREKIRRRLETLPTQDRTATLQSLLQRGREHLARLQKRTDFLARAAEADRHAERIRRQLQVLAEPVGTGSSSSKTSAEPAAWSCGDLVPPLAATVTDFQQRLTTLTRERDAARQRAADAAAERSRLADQLHTFDHLRAIPDSSELRQQRQHRDAGWSLVRSRLEGTPVSPPEGWEEVAPQELVRTYEAAIEQADAGADRRFEAAEVVAQREQVTAALLRQEIRQTELEQAIAAAEARLAEAEQAWLALWDKLPVRPQSPATMLEWLALWKQGAELEGESAARRQEAAALEAQNSTFESELFELFPEAAPSAEAALGQAQDRWQEERGFRTERETLETEQHEVAARLATLEREQEELSRRQQEADHRRRTLAEELHLPADGDVSTLISVLRGARELQEKHRQVLTAAEQRERLEATIARFETAVQGLVAQLAPDLERFPPPDATEELILRLDAARQAELEATRRQASLDAADQLLATGRASRAQVVGQIAAVLTAHGLTEETAVSPLVETLLGLARQREQLAEAEQQCLVMGGDDDAFREALAGLDEDKLAVERQTTEEAIRQEERAHREQLTQLARLQTQWEALEANARAAELGSTLEDLRSRLGGAVDRWAPLVLTQSLMTDALRRFEQEHQPQILIDTAQLLGRFTGGEYVDLQRKLDDRGTLLVVPAQGQPKQPSQLSTGTREQLYLAIRLAYLKSYGLRAEPLPIVMDDVLVNFDEDRARRTLEALVEFGRSHQILFLTCHRRIVETLRQIDPTVSPVELSPGSFSSSEPPVVEPSAAEETGTPRTTKRRTKKASEPDRPALFPPR